MIEIHRARNPRVDYLYSQLSVYLDDKPEARAVLDALNTAFPGRVYIYGGWNRAILTDAMPKDLDVVIDTDVSEVATCTNLLRLTTGCKPAVSSPVDSSDGNRYELKQGGKVILDIWQIRESWHDVERPICTPDDLLANTDFNVNCSLLRYGGDTLLVNQDFLRSGLLELERGTLRFVRPRAKTTPIFLARKAAKILWQSGLIPNDRVAEHIFAVLDLAYEALVPKASDDKEPNQ